MKFLFQICLKVCIIMIIMILTVYFEVEYMSGLDMVWAVRGLHLFSSFRLRAIYYRPAAHLAKLLLLVLYAATFRSIGAQAFGMTGLLLLLALAILALRPFRLTVFNVAMAVGYFCLTGDALFGAIITQFNPTQVRRLGGGGCARR